MPHTAFPVDNDIQTFVTNAGVAIPSGFSFVGLGALAQREFERRSNRIPFLKDASDVDRVYNPPGGKSAFMSGPFAGVASSYTTVPLASYGGGQYLELDAGLLSLTSIYKDITAATPAGTLLVQGTDFVLVPANAPAKGDPWTGVEMLVPFWGQRLSVKVTGKWGYSAILPEDVWQACLALGGASALGSIKEGISTAANKIRTKDEETTFADSEDIGKAWNKQANDVIKRYYLRLLGV